MNGLPSRAALAANGRLRAKVRRLVSLAVLHNFGGAGNAFLGTGAKFFRLAGGAGNDWLTGGAGLDNFVIKPGFGRDVITNFGATPANQDLLQVSNKVFANMQAFMAAARQSGSDVIITATPTDVLTLKNVTLASLDAADLRFTT
jgi:Ca2+-binding RTX toxin-like protein